MSEFWADNKMYQTYESEYKKNDKLLFKILREDFVIEARLKKKHKILVTIRDLKGSNPEHKFTVKLPKK